METKIEGLSVKMDSPYSAVICNLLARTFPRRLTSAAELIDVLTDEILGTKQTRYGPKPAPESIVAIREVLARYIARDLPIPFMVPWGSEKPDGSGVDVAEFYALKTMEALYARIAEHYGPGAQFRVRLEDASAPHLFFEDKPRARANAKRYVDGFTSLVNVLGLPFVTPVPESFLTTEEDFERQADAVLPVIEDQLQNIVAGFSPTNSYANERLAKIGWSGGLAPVTVDYYLTQYAKLYPGKTLDEHIAILARYFAGALARRLLRIRGDAKEWDGSFLDLSFVAPVPGTSSLFSRRIAYRTMPMSFTSLHLPPWRAKGYFEINNDNEVTPKLAPYSEPKEYEVNAVTLTRGTASVIVQMDYILT